MRTPSFTLASLALAAMLGSASPAFAQRRTGESRSRGGAGQGVVCQMLEDSDVTALLGATKPKESTAGHCTWIAAAGIKKIQIYSFRASGLPAVGAFERESKEPAKPDESKPKIETGVSDKAFSVLQKDGVQIELLKGQKMIRVTFVTGVKGTAADVEKLRPVAKKAADAL